MKTTLAPLEEEGVQDLERVKQENKMEPGQYQGAVWNAFNQFRFRDFRAKMDWELFVNGVNK